MSEHKSYYTLPEIATWDEEEKVSLPTVQRGFVWKPSQIENLWDSLLRGYPVGAFVFSDAENNKLHILDGQQRATAICLGFARETFRDSQDYYKVFIDLQPPPMDDSRKYIFRVITKSHPWGYQRKENAKTLTAENIRKAMDLYEDITDPLNTKLEKFFPYDSGLAVPLHFFLNAASNTTTTSEDDLINKIRNEYIHWELALTKWKNDNDNSLASLDEQAIDLQIETRIRIINRAVQEMLHPEKGQKIPALYMNLEKVMNTTEQEPDNASDEVENLFVRLNSGGTQLTGEELNYSILKAHLDRTVQDEIEESCKQLFKPARFITIAYRLYQQQNKEEKQNDALTMRIKPKQFQRTISKEKKDFENYVLKLIREKSIEGKSLLEYAQSVLEYKTTNQKHYGLPFLIYSKLADTAPELMFLLLYRIIFKNDRFSDINKSTESEHRTMLGILTLFMWFGKGENLKDHAKLLSNIWPAASSLEKNRFWSAETIERAYLNDVLLPFPAFKSNKHENGLDKIWNYNLTEKTNVLNRFENEAGEKYKYFLQKSINNKDLILYAQRHFIESYFSQQQYRLEDTSLPFDWDHISPNNFVRNKKSIPRIVKDWYQTNGNFRAWPYALNRMDSDNSPAFKLNPLENHYGNGSFEIVEQKWQRFIDSNSHLIDSKNQISKKLLEWSFCEKEWAVCFIGNIRTDWKAVTRLVIYRNFELIKEWYEQLNLESLRKENLIKMEDLFDKRKWDVLPLKVKEFDEEFELDETAYHISSPCTIGNGSLNFFIGYPLGEKGYLEENNIEFGLFELKGNNYIQKMKNKTDFEIDTSNFKWIFGNFTLISGHYDSYKELLIGITEWMKKLPISQYDKKILITEFREVLSSKFKQVIE